MIKKILNVGLIGKTNAGKSTLLNSIIGEKISIENKKINTTLETIIGIINIGDTQIIFFDKLLDMHLLLGVQLQLLQQ